MFCLTFQVIDTRDAPLSSSVCHPGRLHRPQLGDGERGGPCSGTAGTQVPQLRSKVVQLVQEMTSPPNPTPSQRLFPGNTGLQCEKVQQLFVTAALRGNPNRNRNDSALDWRTSTPRTVHGPSVLLQSWGGGGSLTDPGGAEQSGDPLKAPRSDSHQSETGFTFHRPTMV